MHPNHTQRGTTATRYRARAIQLRIECAADAPGHIRDEKLRFARQWDLLAAAIEDRKSASVPAAHTGLLGSHLDQK
jgi:hypothetical protein